MLKKILTVLALLIVVIAGGGFGYLYMKKPAMVPASDIKVEMSPERIERGKYIFQLLADCDGCHSQRDFTRFGGPVMDSGRGMGGVFPTELGLPGTVVASNITPDRETGIGAWTDGEKIRAIREGVDRDGRTLFPMMPYTYFKQMSDQDVQSVVAYMNTLPAVRNPLPATKINFPVSLLIKGAPQPAGSVAQFNRHDRMKYGEYLVAMGGCLECHTKMDKGEPLPGMRLAGGREFRMPYGVVVSANITPDVETGIGKWTEPHFLDKIYQYKEYVDKGSPPAGPDSFTLMPWLALCQLSAEDLGAIFTYLKAQPAVRNYVEMHPGYPNKK